MRGVPSGSGGAPAHAPAPRELVAAGARVQFHRRAVGAYGRRAEAVAGFRAAVGPRRRCGADRARGRRGDRESRSAVRPGWEPRRSDGMVRAAGLEPARRSRVGTRRTDWARGGDVRTVEGTIRSTRAPTGGARAAADNSEWRAGGFRPARDHRARVAEDPR